MKDLKELKCPNNAYSIKISSIKKSFTSSKDYILYNVNYWILKDGKRTSNATKRELVGINNEGYCFKSTDGLFMDCYNRA